MNRREALKILTAMPAVATIARLDVRAGDVIVVEAPGFISAECVERIRNGLLDVFPHNRIVVLGDGLAMKVLRS